MHYPKINSLFKRDTDKKKSLLIDDYALPEFGLIKHWHVEEKIDGTNIRIDFVRAHTTPDTVVYKGRTDESQIPDHLLNYLTGFFTYERLAHLFIHNTSVTLYGEGYGPKIQSGDYYRDTPGFILFDILLDNKLWLTRQEIKLIADQLGLPVPADLGIMTEQEVIAFVKSNPPSRVSIQQHCLEGIIARPEPLLLLQNGTPLMWKLKCRDFR